MLNFRTLQRVLLGSLVAAALTPFSTNASTVYVAPGAAGDGTSGNPFGRIADALAVAVAGDTILLKPGTLFRALPNRSRRHQCEPLGDPGRNDGKAILTSAAGNVVRVSHPYVTIRGLVVDGQYGPYRAVLVDSAATALHPPVPRGETHLQRLHRQCARRPMW